MTAVVGSLIAADNALMAMSTRNAQGEGRVLLERPLAAEREPTRASADRRSRQRRRAG
jgi:hypothetical protein